MQFDRFFIKSTLYSFGSLGQLLINSFIFTKCISAGSRLLRWLIKAMLIGLEVMSLTLIKLIMLKKWYNGFEIIWGSLINYWWFRLLSKARNPEAFLINILLNFKYMNLFQKKTLGRIKLVSIYEAN